MSIVNIVTAFGGLAMFLYGMSMLGTGLEKVSGGLLEAILKKLTGNIILGVLLGALVTAVIQSSGATTVIVIGLVNAGLLKLRGAIGVIMGANIGTTVTAQILRLTDLEGNADAGVMLQLLKPSALAAFAAIVGMIILFASKKSKRRTIGEILIGFSILFSGMLTMEASIKPLAADPSVSGLFASLENPILGILVGAAVTALLQSSSVSIGILQALSTTGAITFSAAFPIILGTNIGSCVTSLIACIGANKNAKRTAMVHLYFNVIGTIIYFALVYIVTAVAGDVIPYWNEPIDKGIIANFHGIFNISVTLLFIPFSFLLEKLAMFTVRDKKNDDRTIDTENLLDERFLSTPSLALTQAHKTIIAMAKYAQYNFRETAKLFSKFDTKAVERIKEYENTIDLMDDGLNNYLIKLSDNEMTAEENCRQTYLLHLTAEYERIGDYAMNLMENADTLNDKGAELSEAALTELKTLYDSVDEMVEMSITAFSYSELKTCEKIEQLEEIIDALEDTVKARHILRFKSGLCGVEAGIGLVDAITNLERIGDHCTNIAGYVVRNERRDEELEGHRYMTQLHLRDSDDYRGAVEEYAKKYHI